MSAGKAQAGEDAMSKVIKNIQVSWQWKGDEYAIKGFNIAITPKNSNPNEEVTAFARSGGNTRSYIFRDVILDSDFSEYTAWVQALYEGADSDWVSANSFVVPDDGLATIASESYVDTQTGPGRQAAEDTEAFRNPVPPTNSPTNFTAVVPIAYNSNGTKDVILTWQYTQGAYPADAFEIFWTTTTTNPNYASDSVTVAATSRSYVFHGLPAGQNRCFAIAARRLTSQGEKLGPLVFCQGNPIYTGDNPTFEGVAKSIKESAAGNITFDANGITIYEASNHKRFVRLKPGGIGFTTDGGTTFKNAITPNGILASAITVTDTDPLVANISSGGQVKINGSGAWGYDGQGQVQAGFGTNGEFIAGGGRVRANRDGIWGYSATAGGTKQAGFSTDGKFVAGGGTIVADANGFRAADFRIDSSGHMSITSPNGNFRLSTNELVASYNGQTTVNMNFTNGGVYIKGSIEAGVLILPGSPPP